MKPEIQYPRSMEAQWKKKKKSNPQVIINDLEDNKRILEGGDISYEGHFGTFDVEFAASVLAGMIEFPKKLEPRIHESLVGQAISDVSKMETLSQTSLIDRINILVTQQLRQRENKYHVLTSLSLKHAPFRTREFDGVTIRILNGGFPKKYSSRDTIDFEGRYTDKLNYGYLSAIITAKSRHQDSAYSKAMETLDLIRALWNLQVIPKWEFVQNEFTPINRIRTGAVHTLHKKNGALANKQYWYEPNFVSSTPYNFAQYKNFDVDTRTILDGIHQSAYSIALKSAMLKYVRALDERDANVAIIRLWSALESLTSPDHANYELMVKRISFLYSEHEIQLQILEHLREVRNKNVHVGEQSGNARRTCLHLARYFQTLIFFHANNPFDFTSLAEANSFLDLPTSKTELEKRRVLIDKRIKFIS